MSLTSYAIFFIPEGNGDAKTMLTLGAPTGLHPVQTRFLSMFSSLF